MAPNASEYASTPVGVSRPTQIRAGAPVSTILDRLRQVGWGLVLLGQWHGVIDTLVALSTLVDDVTGCGYATVDQIAERSGMSRRWQARHTRRCLHVLEDLGVIIWRRGYVDDRGRPHPSFFRISKGWLVDQLDPAHSLHEELRASHRAETNARLKALAHVPRRSRRRSRKRLAWSAPIDTCPNLPFRELTPAAETGPPATLDRVKFFANLARGQIATRPHPT